MNKTNTTEVIEVDYLNPTNNRDSVREALASLGFVSLRNIASSCRVEGPSSLVKTGAIRPEVIAASVAAMLFGPWPLCSAAWWALSAVELRPVEDGAESIGVYDRLIQHETGRHVGDEPGEDELYAVFINNDIFVRIAYIAVRPHGKTCFVMRA